MTIVQTGLETLIESPPLWMKGLRLGLLSNPASVDRSFRHAARLIQQFFPGQLRAMFAPQHGFFAEKQDNMIESADMIDPVSGVPIFSLYGQTRRPTPNMLKLIDILLVDLQDAGTRVYTFATTLSYAMEAAKTRGIKVVVLDRPNPVNGVTLEGNCLSPECASFVGRYGIPMRHGLTMGELARLFNVTYGIGCDLEVIPMKGWKRIMYFRDTGLPWIAPSPNLPTPVSAMVYPGQVLWEGTNVSEGRGTTQPFEIFGAPFIDIEKLSKAVADATDTGVILRPLSFEPTANKWQGRLCRGFQLHITDPDRYRPYRTSLRLLQAIKRQHDNEFQWKSPPYEYEFERLPIDLIIGNRKIRERIEMFDDMDAIEKSWEKELSAFNEIRKTCYLYG
ncbi:MAG: DUF1343 domain-containing protein [Thermodesulfobacteriota bacterium]